MLSLSLPTFDIVWQDLGFSRPPLPLQVPSVGMTVPERVRIRAEVYRELENQRLFSRQVLDESLAECLETLARAATYVECEVLQELDAELPLRAVVAMGHELAVLAVQRAEVIELSVWRNADSLPALVNLLPYFPLGEGSAIRLPVKEFEAAKETPHGEVTYYHHEVKQVRAIERRRIVRAGQLSVRKRQRDGRINRVGGGSWFVNDRGGYFGGIEPSPGGDWLTVVPVNGPALVAQLVNLIHRTG